MVIGPKLESAGILQTVRTLLSRAPSLRLFSVARVGSKALKVATPALLLFLAAAISAYSQPGQQLRAADSTALGAPTTVHGVVKNALSGEPLPRALVLVDGGGGMGALTDGDGRFEIPGVSPGPNVFQVSRPGFEDAAGVPAGAQLRDMRGFSHNVFVTKDTPELVFSMRPSNSIRGRIDLSTGDPASNSVTLLRRQIVNGRAVWHQDAGTRANADGWYHFAHLQDGDYAVVAEPAPESDIVTAPALADSDRDIASNWYPQIYYPDARDFAGAARIHLAAGEQVQANLTMPLEAFHPVRATLELPAEFRGGEKLPGAQFEITSPDGHHLPYPGVYNSRANAVEVILPDGTYALHVSAFTSASNAMSSRIMGAGRDSRLAARAALTGQLDFTVAGHTLNKLRIPVGPQTPTPVEIDVNRTSTRAASPGNHGEVFIEISQAGPLTDGMQGVFAQGSGPGSIDTMSPSPGRYWIHTIVADSTLCESSFTAGGASLAREPLVVGQG
ncbi:MAG TPA: carboxypeptidase-like regulatory domain-containing protein, partial [Steroidobacteraceae bacterium]|nr:carboxypeptidase-like regulatory domain-containing protein [Steroidobacteraceae bacterium]